MGKSVSIRSYGGASDTIIEAYDMSKNVFRVTANYVNIGGFTIKDGDRGISLDEVMYCNISNNNIILNYLDGIFLDSSFNNTIKNNIVNSNEINGIALVLSYNNIVENNTANLNEDDGISLSESDIFFK
jgi:parallel beta-helix repeat protein